LATPEPIVAARASSRWRSFYELTKPRVVMLIVFTSIVGTLLAVPGLPPLDALIFGNLGVGLAAASAAVINHVLDERIDAQMSRTKRRPLPTGRMSARAALVFAAALCVVSMLMLCLLVNLLTAALTFASLIGYAVIYTVWLKRATSQNIVIGGAAGAVPVLIGWTAVTGGLAWPAVVLFVVIFLWTPPHFWALAIRYADDYRAAGVPMLPAVAPAEQVGRRMLTYTLALWVSTLVLAPVAGLGWIYGVTALVLGALFAAGCVGLVRDPSPRRSMQVFAFSISYITILFGAIAADVLVRSGW
jgi:heme o synthase